jgi:hypothetical protein
MALPQPDFLRPVARPGWLAWAWCGTGLLVLAVTAVDGQSAWQQRQHSQQALAGITAPAQAPAAAARPGSSRLAAQARLTEAARWQQQLALDWPAVWAASEAAPDGIQWLQFEHGQRSGLRLTGLAADLAPAETAAAVLRGQRDAGAPVWRDVALSAVERVQQGHRFVLVAHLAAEPKGAMP